MIEEFREINFFKMGIFDIDEKIEISNFGRVRKEKNGKEIFIGYFSPSENEAIFKLKRKKIYIKFALCLAFFPDYVFKKNKIIFLDGDHSNLNLVNIRIENFKKDCFQVPEEKYISMFEKYLNSGILRKMIFKCCCNYSFVFNNLYSEEDVYQDCITYCWSKLYLYDSSKNFELFLYGKIKDCLIILIKEKIERNKYFTFNVETLISNYEKQDKKELFLALF